MTAHPPARVLLVEEDDAWQWVVRAALEHAGYLVSAAPDGASVLEQVRASQHALVIVLDLLRPDRDGLPLLQRIADEASTARRHAYLLLTARRQTFPLPVVRLFQQLGVRVLQKPVDLDTLVAVVEQAAIRLA